jgi:peptidoglycan hydrolase CwlO-like protein
MSRPIDLIIGKIEELYSDRNAGWEAFFKADYAMDKLVDEIADLKKEVKRLKEKIKSRG